MANGLLWKEIRYTKEAVAWQAWTVSYLELRKKKKKGGGIKSYILPNYISFTNKIFKKTYIRFMKNEQEISVRQWGQNYSDQRTLIGITKNIISIKRQNTSSYLTWIGVVSIGSYQ